MPFGLVEVAVILFLIGWLLQLLLGKGKLNMIFAILFFIGAVFYIIASIGSTLWMVLWIIIAILAIISAFAGKK
jgi:predicted membrane protein